MVSIFKLTPFLIDTKLMFAGLCPCKNVVYEMSECGDNHIMKVQWANNPERREHDKYILEKNYPETN